MSKSLIWQTCGAVEFDHVCWRKIQQKVERSSPYGGLGQDSGFIQALDGMCEFTMTDEMQSLLIGLVAGAAGYLIVTFWIQPILRYREIRERVHSDLIYYADATNADGLNEEMKERMWARVSANRRHSSDLRAVFGSLPWWYRRWLVARGHDPERVAKDLMGLSNTFKHEDAATRVQRIRSGLGLPSST